MNQLISLSSVLLAGAAVAQPSHIILHLDQSTELVYKQHDVPETVHLNRTTVPVFSELEDGTLVPGVYYRGMSQSGFHAKRYPAYVTQLADGSWEVEWVRWSVIHGPKNKKWERKIHGSVIHELP